MISVERLKREIATRTERNRLRRQITATRQDDYVTVEKPVEQPTSDFPVVEAVRAEVSPKRLPTLQEIACKGFCRWAEIDGERFFLFQDTCPKHGRSERYDPWMAQKGAHDYSPCVF